MDELEVSELVEKLWAEWNENRDHSLEWQEWALGRQPLPVIPDTATNEYRELQKKSITPWLGLLVQSLAQSLIVDGYRRSDADGEDPQLWNVWQANRMDLRQTALYEAALTTGIAYLAVLPAEPFPEWRSYSSAQMTAWYHSDDDWPEFAMAAEPRPGWNRQHGDTPWRVTFFDRENVYIFDRTGAGKLPIMVSEPRRHGFDHIPIVRYVNRQTITGKALGEVEPYIAAASRVDQAVFDRQMVQRFGAWVVRWATGLDQPETDEDKRAAEMQVRQNELLVSESSETKFGHLPATPLDGHLRAEVQEIRMLASVSQTPPQLLTGDIVNVSAEALAAIEASYNRKVEQRKQAFGESHEQAFNLSARLLRIDEDDTAQVIWRDMESRAMSQTADALGKIAQMLEVPVEILWEKLGFLTGQDLERARNIRESQDATAQLLGMLGSGLEDDEEDEEPEVA